jgi:hypothetical protein
VCGGVVSAAGSQKRHLTRKRNASSCRELVRPRKIAKSDLARFVTTSELLPLSTDVRSAAHRRARSPP